MTDVAHPAGGRHADPSTDRERAERVREAAARVVSALYRVVKGCTLHSDSNQAVGALVAATSEAVGEACSATGRPAVSVLFAAGTVFVDRRLLKASRETYAIALELGALLEGCGVSEVTLERSAARKDVAAFARAVADAQRDRSLAARITERDFGAVRARRVRAFGGGPQDRASPAERAVRTYAISIVSMRAFFSDLRRGKLELPYSVKRVAQKIVSAADAEARTLVALAAVPPTSPDEAAVAVSSAILAVAAAQKLTTDRDALARVAMAALLFDAGRPRLTGAEGAGGRVERALTADERRRLPASTALVLTVLGKLHPPSIARAVIAYEAAALHADPRLAYDGRRSPTPLARALVVARAFVELRTPALDAPPLGMDAAIQVLQSRAADATEKTFVKVLISALGLFPAGTLVELSTGELGVVLATPELPADFARPVVRVMYDERSILLERPFDVDLAAPSQAKPRAIRRAIDADEQQAAAMRGFVMATVEGRSTPTPPSAREAPRSPPAPRGAASGERPVAPSRDSRPESGHTITMKPPSSRRGQAEWGPGGAPPPAPTRDATKRVSWHEIDAILAGDPERPAGSKPIPRTDPEPHDPRRDQVDSDPAPSRQRRRKDLARTESPPSPRDQLLAAFLADEPIPDPDGAADLLQALAADRQRGRGR